MSISYALPRRSVVAAVALCFSLLLLGLPGLEPGAASPAAAQPLAGPFDQWQALGPEGGTVTAFATDPGGSQGVWAASSEGAVFFSADRGVTWEARGVAPVGDVRLLAPDVGDPDRLVAVASAAAGAGIAVTEDGGRTWGLAGSAGTVREAAVPGAPPVLFRRLGSGPVERSVDLGGTWQPVTGLPDGLNLDRIAQATAERDRLWAVLRSGDGAVTRVFRSSNAGESWEPAEGVAPGQLPNDAAWVDVSIGGSEGSTLGLIAEDGRLLVSETGGDTWQLTGTVTGEAIGFRDVLALELDRQDATVIYLLSGSEGTGGRIAVSTDGGATFSLSDALGGKTVQSLVALAGAGREALFGLATEGVWAGSGAAASAGPTNGGLHGTVPSSLATLPGPPRRLFTIVPFFGLLERVGAVWQKVPVPATSPGFAVAEVPPSTLYATDINFFFLRSTDGGTTWSVTSTDLDLCLIPDTLATTPANPDHLLVSGGITSPACESLNRCGLFRSLDGGETFSCIRGEVGGSADEGGAGLPSFVQELVVDPGDPDRIFAAAPTYGGEGVFRSLDGGATWEHVLPDVVHSLLMLPATPQVLFAVGDDVHRSTDGGTTWAVFDIELPGGASVTRLFAQPGRPDTLLAAGGAGGLFVSDDGGESWAELGSGLPANLGVLDLRSNPDDPRTLYVSTAGLGVYRITRADTSPCVPDGRTLCLQQGRFEVTTTWEDFQGGRGVGHANAETDDSGWFWFFNPDNVELLVKALDGRVINDRFWFFYGALSNVEYTITVRDTQTGEMRQYLNPSGRFASVGDTEAFPVTPPAAVSTAVGPTPRAASDPVLEVGAPTFDQTAPDSCEPDGLTLCLQDGRFRVVVTWRDFQGGQGRGQAVPLSGDVSDQAADDSGFFWFFEPDNLELVVKVIDGRTINGNFWFFYGALSNVEYEIEVTDVESGRQRVYSNPAGRFASLGDTATFDGSTFCGGIGGFPCAEGQVCDLDPGSCQVSDAGGTCRELPEACPEVFEPVCGCDGRTYGNDCERLRAGVTKDHDGACEAP